MSYLPNEYKIYFLSSSDNPDEIRYIGLTKHGNSHKNNWINKIRKTAGYKWKFKKEKLCHI